MTSDAEELERLVAEESAAAVGPTPISQRCLEVTCALSANFLSYTKQISMNILKQSFQRISRNLKTSDILRNLSILQVHLLKYYYIVSKISISESIEPRMDFAKFAES